MTKQPGVPDMKTWSVTPCMSPRPPQGDGGLFAREGAKVLAADINRDAALETKRIIDGEGGICEAVSADVSRADDVSAMVSGCVAAFGRIDVLHNNVGIVEVGGPVETTEESWDRVNCFHPLKCIKRWGARDVLGQTLMQRTYELSAPDDRTIVFRLKKPFVLLPDALGKLAGNLCAIMPERLALTDPYKQVTEMVGSGPFRFKKDEWVQDCHRVYERFTNYNPREDGSPEGASGPKIVHFDRVEWHIISDPATSAAALRTGEMDWWAYPAPDLLPLLRQDGKIMTQIYPSGFCSLLRPNHLFPPFDNPAVRRALMGAIDQAEFMTAVYGPDRSSWQVPVGFFPPNSPFASGVGLWALTSPRDYSKVKRELEAAGYRGEKIALLAPTQPWFKDWCSVAAEMMRKVGMDVDYQAMDGAASIQRAASKKPPDQGGWSAIIPAFPGDDLASPATHVALRGNGEQAPLPGWPISPKIEALRDQWLDATDLATQKKLAADIQAQAFIDVPYYPLGINYPSTAFRSDLKGVLTAYEAPVFWNVRREA